MSSSIFMEFDLNISNFKMNILLSYILMFLMLYFFLKNYFLKEFYFLNYLLKFINMFKSYLFVNMKIISLISFMFIMLMNIFSLILPHYIKMSVHLHFTMFLSFFLWLMMIISYILKSPSYFIQHNIPSGSPVFLFIKLFIIEMISTIIRPLTLSFRICAIMSGANIIMNMLLSMILIYFPMFNFNMMNMLIFINMFLLSFILFLYDFMVCVIQSYIFISLINNYIKEQK